MAASTFHVTVGAASGSAISTFHVDANPPASAARSTFHVTVAGAIPYLQVPNSSGVLKRAQLGRFNGTTIDWLSPDL